MWAEHKCTEGGESLYCFLNPSTCWPSSWWLLMGKSISSRKQGRMLISAFLLLSCCSSAFAGGCCEYKHVPGFFFLWSNHCVDITYCQSKQINSSSNIYFPLVQGQRQNLVIMSWWNSVMAQYPTSASEHYIHFFWTGVKIVFRDGCVYKKKNSGTLEYCFKPSWTYTSECQEGREPVEMSAVGESSHCDINDTDQSWSAVGESSKGDINEWEHSPIMIKYKCI